MTYSTANESYKGTFITDVYDAHSTVKQPDHLLFAEGIHKVLKQVHPDTTIDLGGLYCVEDYNRYLFSSIMEQAAKLASEKRCVLFEHFAEKLPLADQIKFITEDFIITGEDGTKVLIFCKRTKNLPKGDIDFLDRCGWESRSYVQTILPAAMKEWGKLGNETKKSVFEEWLALARSPVSYFFYFFLAIVFRT